MNAYAIRASAAVSAIVFAGVLSFSGSKPADTPAPAKPPGAEEEGEDKDPYEGIAPEDLPPDLQYDADSSVSFPTNT